MGLLLAVGGTRLLSQLDAVRIPLLEQIRVDIFALGFTLLTAVLTGVLFGLVPAIRSSTLSLQTALKESGRGASQSKRHGWIRSALVVSEVAFACVLLVGAGLLIRSFLRAMGIQLRAGRDFSPADNPSSPRVIIINETLARDLWPGEDPLGKIMIADGERQVVGVVRDVRHLALERESGGEMYIPFRQRQQGSFTLVVRGSHSLAGLASGVREALRPVDPNLLANEFRPIQDLVDRSVSPRRLIVLLLAGFAGFALILASLGIYGVISYSVSQRKQEIRPNDVRGCARHSYGCRRAGRLPSRDAGVATGPGRVSPRRIKIARAWRITWERRHPCLRGFRQ